MTTPGIGKKTVRDIDVAGKRVLVRADLNVPLDDGAVGDEKRIRESLPTIQYLVAQGARVIVCSHLGRPKGPDPKLSLAPVAARLGNLLGQEVLLAADCVGKSAADAVDALAPGDVLLLENLRFHPEEVTVLRQYLWGVRVDDVESPVLRELVDRISLTIPCKATCHCQLI